MSEPAASLEAALDELRLVICVGSGGVGKTSLAATLGLQAALRGRKVLVVTIDPARRLANALGLKQFGNDETRIDLSGVIDWTSGDQTGGEEKGPAGELWATMLDTRRTFDDLIARIARSPEQRARILENNIYQNISNSFSSSQDYMATELLFDVVQSGRYDLVVLDTPPVKNALDFLEAPGRLARFLDKRIIKWFLTPYDEGRVFGRLLMGTSAVVFRLLGYIFGRDFLGELSEFFLHFRGLYEGFQHRQEAVVGLFGSSSTTFLVISAPNGPSMDVAGYFIDELAARGMPNGGVIVNQIHNTLGQELDPVALLRAEARAEAADLAPDTVERVLARLGAAHGRLRELSRLEAEHIAALRRRVGDALPIWTVPRYEGELHDLVALAEVGRRLLVGPDAS